MPKYNYVLVNTAGLKSEGSIAASSVESAREKLKEEGEIIISIVETKKIHTWFWQKPKLSIREKMLFTKHMATMIKVGITVQEAFEILIEQTKEKNNSRMFKNILEMIQSGQSLSKSLRKYDYVFSEIFINMISTGEETGRLEEVLEYLDIQLEKEYEIKKKVVTAFIYPAIIIGITLILALGIVIFIMPKITKIFESFNIKLPLITRILIKTSTFMINSPLLTILLVVGIIASIATIFKLKALKPFWHKIIINLPVFGKILISANLARFSRTMNSLLQSGVPVSEGIDITANMIGNSLYKKALKEARDKVEQGGKLGESLEGNEKLFPQLATKMLFIGEKTGSLEVTTERLAELYENNVDAITKNLSILLEPILLVFMAGLVGGIALAIILPIYQLPTLLQQ